MDTLLHGLGVLLRWLIEGLLEWLFGYLCYAAGWLVLRLLTLGRYPRLPLRQSNPDAPRSRWVVAFGFLCLVGLPLAILVFLYG
jgi:hypothetical protein